MPCFTGKKTFILLLAVLSLWGKSIAQSPLADTTFQVPDSVLLVPDGKLKWEYFTGSVDPRSPWSAIAHWNVYYKYEVLGFRSDTVLIRARSWAAFRKSNWVVPGKERDALLQHEQGHYDLAVACALAFRKAVDSTVFLRQDYRKTIMDIYNALLVRCRQLQDQYDEESDHSRNLLGQMKWNLKIRELLDGQGFARGEAIGLPQKSGIVFPGLAFTSFWDTLSHPASLSVPKTNPDSVALLAPFFTTNICSPADTMHPRFLRHMAWAKKASEETKQLLQEKLRRLPKGDSLSAQLIARLGKPEAIRNCRLVPLPHYYLTLNAVTHDGSRGFLNFYNLDTFRIDYGILSNGRMVGIAYRVPSLNSVQVFLRPFNTYDSLAFMLVDSLRQRPLLLHAGNYNESMYHTDFGCLWQNHLLIARLYQGTRWRYSESKWEEVPYRNRIVFTAENFYLGPGTSVPFSNFLKSGYRYAQRMRTQPQPQKTRIAVKRTG